MTVFNDIRAALEGEIANVSGIPAAAQRAWENVRFEPTTGTAWVRMELVPTSSRRAARGPGAQTRHEGLFLVFVNQPEGAGPAAAETLADNIRARFTAEDGYTVNGVTVRFEDDAERSQGVLDAPWYRVTVTARWFAYASS